MIQYVIREQPLANPTQFLHAILLSKCPFCHSYRVDLSWIQHRNRYVFFFYDEPKVR